MLKETLSNNLGAKLMALVMALALWLFATGKYTGELSCTVPIEVSFSEGYMLLDQSSTAVNIKLTGPKSSIDYVSDLVGERKIIARCGVPVEGRESEEVIEEMVILDKRNFNLPSEVTLDMIRPKNIKLLLVRRETKTLTVALQKRGEPMPGYMITREFFFPFDVQVTGPANILKDATAIKTIPIDISNITPEQNRTFPWQVPLEQRVVISRNDKATAAPVECEGMINVWLDIAEELVSKNFEKVGIKLLEPPGFPYNIELEQKSVNLKVKGPKSVLDKLAVPDVYINVSDLKPPGPYKQPLICKLPPMVELDGKLPEIHLDITTEEVAKK
ncbi:MAG TPA: CdaR family protein [Candidatus Avalokitesvara rifleensis]|uniref:CdaR family protein n=1 Tax=Candidatus Avalokitesvara rifleensis TaxID=3367620 RepID=UPI002712FD5B|nr:CdaR family protein [Candidatus Brocadiales bacterium]